MAEREEISTDDTTVAPNSGPSLNDLAQRDNTVSIVYPPAYEMIEKDPSERTPGILQEYYFSHPFTDPGIPVLNSFIMQTADSSAAGLLATADFDAEGTSFQNLKEIEGSEISEFNNRMFYVRNTGDDENSPADESGPTIRHYVTFIGGTRLEVRIWMPSPSLSMQADELFREVVFVSKEDAVR